MSMAIMFSPDDPLFWMNHCNIDRFYLFWMDCNEFESVKNQSITSTHYYAANPINPRGYVAYNPYYPFLLPYKVTADSQIPFYYRSNGDSKVFTSKRWPTPRQVWGATPGAKGYDGMWYGYGPDSLVAELGPACPKNVKWSLVHQNLPKKRSEDEDDTIPPTSRSHALLKEYGKTFRTEIAKGRSHEDVIRSMAMAECLKAPRLQVTQKLLNWISMNNLHISSFDTICDKPSELSIETSDGSAKTQALTAEGSYVPIWVIVSASIGSALLMIAIVTLIIIYFRKTQNPTSDDSYTVMKE
jgi:hypothetical protein